MNIESIDYGKLPGLLGPGMKRYVEDGIPTGDFLKAVLENRFLETIGKADQHSLAGIKDIAQLVYNDLPCDCHGSPEIVTAWIERGGVNGQKKEG